MQFNFQKNPSSSIFLEMAALQLPWFKRLHLHFET